MNPYFRKFATLAPTLLLATVLASCGGGGGGSAAPSYQGVVSTVPAVTYISQNLVISGTINDDIRNAAGFGKLAQSTALDSAALKHAAFLVDNDLVDKTAYLSSVQAGGILGGHYEDSGASFPANFTGASPQARATAAGYVGNVTELMIFGAADGAACIASLENSVYHLIALVSPYVDMGISFNAGSGSGSACAIVLGVNSSTLGQLPASPVVYPYDTQTGVAPTFYNQAEVPIPASDLPTAGHPVVVSLYTLSNPSLAVGDIVINEFSITKDVDVTPLAAVRVLAKTGVTFTDPTLVEDDLIPAAGFVVLLPEAPLEANTPYHLSFSATVKGVAVIKTWSFTTGVAN